MALPSEKANEASYAEPFMHVVDLDAGEQISVPLPGGKHVDVEVFDVIEEREPVFGTLMLTTVRARLNGELVELKCGSYRLPVTVGGIQVDVPAVSGYMKDAHTDWWKLEKSVRLRFWPAGSPWIEPESFRYPVKQRWSASRTWFSNEPVSPRKMGHVYYHAGMDIGGAEGLTEIVSATDGKIITLGEEAAADKHPAVRPRYDVIYVQDERGWVYRYSHLCSFDPNLRLGDNVAMGQRLGYAGKEGSSGGWCHLHFGIESEQPSGSWGIQDTYAFFWQAYIEEHAPPVLAVTGPHIKTLPGHEVVLDASGSWSLNGIRNIEWSFLDGTTQAGTSVKKTYAEPGVYSEMVKVTDNEGHVDFDFVRVEVYPKSQFETDEIMATALTRVHVAYYPTMGINAGDPVLFKSRGFNTGDALGYDVYDFGDGSGAVKVPSNIDGGIHAVNGYGSVVHHYQQAGDYIVSVSRVNEQTDRKGYERLHIRVG